MSNTLKLGYTVDIDEQGDFLGERYPDDPIRKDES